MRKNKFILTPVFRAKTKNKISYPKKFTNKEKLAILKENDNDSRFAAKTVQDYFHENHINQVFTHPYTPQENGHIEFYHTYNTVRLPRIADHC